MSVLLLLQDHAPVLTAVLVVAGCYVLLTLRIRATGSCPFAGGGSSKASVAPQTTAAAPAPARRNAMVRLTLAELAAYDGQDMSKPLYVAVRGKIYDVSPGRSFYGPGALLAVAAVGCVLWCLRQHQHLHEHQHHHQQLIWDVFVCGLACCSNRDGLAGCSVACSCLLPADAVLRPHHPHRLLPRRRAVCRLCRQGVRARARIHEGAPARVAAGWRQRPSCLPA